MKTARFFYAIFFLSLIVLAICFQSRYLGLRYGERIPIPECPWCDAAEAQRPDVVYIPLDPGIMRLSAPADPDFLADLLWMRACYYFGQHTLTNREYPFLFHMLDMITELAPKWDLPYFYGAVLLPTEADAVEEGMYIIDKGLIHFPESWDLWFFKGYYLWKNQEDYAAAAEALQKASLLPKAPAFLAPLAATIAGKAGQEEMAIRFLQQAIINMKDPKHIRALERKIEEMKKDG
ncbi:MAG: hypothetical protein AB7S75_21480 [Desulfococcaceae bacterium]